MNAETRDKIYLYHCPQMEALARRIAEIDGNMAVGNIEWFNFKDGFPNLKIKGAEIVRNKDIVFLASFDTPAEIFKQLSVIYEIPRLAVRSFKIVLPFYPTGTMERVEKEGEIATAATLARMLSITPHSMSGPTQIIIYDIHALQERFYFSDAVMPRLQSAIPILKERIRPMADTTTVAFPDEGAWKRYGSAFEGYPYIVCAKLRRDDDRIIMIREGNPAGRHVIIVDDLVMTGGTLLECRKALMDAGARGVSAYATHGVFPERSWQKFIGAGFSHFWITDSCPNTVKAVAGRKPFEVLSLDRDIADILRQK